MLMFGKGLQPKWSPLGKKRAASEFEVPAGTQILLELPDIFDRVELLKHYEFRYEYKDKDGVARVSVKTPCPWCGTNKFVTYPDQSGYKANCCRAIADFRINIPILTAIGHCSNRQCEGNPEKKKAGDSTDRVGKCTVHLYETATWKRYPRAVRERYAPYFFTEVADGSGGEVFVTEDLANEVL
jgi:hypothetical protein